MTQTGRVHTFGRARFSIHRSVEVEIHVRRVLSFGLIALSASVVPAQTTLPDSVVRKIDAVFARYTPDGPGCAAGVYQNGKIAFAKGYGLANIEYGVPLTPRTPVTTGSVTKQFTAAAIALLVEQGRISLDDDVRKYIPELADYGKKITIRHLVHRTSGLRDWWALVSAAGMRSDDAYAANDVLAFAARQKGLNFEPGAEYNYSNTGYILMAIVVQRASGKTLRQFAAGEIFTPLAMSVTHYRDDHNEPLKGRAFAYSPALGKPGGWTINVWNNDIVGQGGLVTTVEELQRWDENFYTDLIRFPSVHTSVVTLCNVSTADAGGMALRVADAVLASAFACCAAPARASAAQQAASVVLPESELAALVGRYYSEELNVTYELTRDGNAIVLRRPRAAVETLAASDARTLAGRGVTLRFTAPGTFTLDNGRARGMVFTRAGR